MIDTALRIAAKHYVYVMRPAFKFWGYVLDEVGEQLA